MDKSFVVGSVLGAVVVTAGGTIAGYQLLNPEDDAPKVAQVLDVQAVTKTIQVPRDECHDETVTYQAPTKDPHKIAGTAAGAALGGLVGSQFGGGSGKKIAAAVGVVGGGLAGRKVQEKMQQGNTVTSTQQRCVTVHDSKEQLLGYDVRYRLGEQEATVRMDHKPGDTLPVENGQVITTPALPPQS